MTPSHSSEWGNSSGNNECHIYGKPSHIVAKCKKSMPELQKDEIHQNKMEKVNNADGLTKQLKSLTITYIGSHNILWLT